MKIDNAAEIIPAIRALGLTAPAALQPDDREYPRIVSLTQDEARANRPFFLDLELGVQWGEGQAPKPFIARGNLNGDGAISFAIVNGKVLLQRADRVLHGTKFWEIPRGFSEVWESETETSVESLPKGMKTALRELEEETGISKETVRKIVPTYLGTMAENSGTHFGRPAYWLLEIDGWDASENPDFKLVTLNEAIQIVDDSHSASALIMYLRHIAATATKAS
jgi:8-oxo-dGTP pyrophosphatase MutT (NUDIX family)